MIVKMCVKPEEWGNRPTRSIGTWLKRLAGVGMVSIGDLVWYVTFPLWQLGHDLVHRVTFLVKLRPTKRLETRRRVVRTPRRARLWNAANIFRRQSCGTHGLGEPVEMSQKN